MFRLCIDAFRLLRKDLNDTLDFTDNDLRRLDGFPPMKRLKHIFAANNRISKIDGEIAKYVPNLETLILTNNQISELGDLDPLESCKGLTMLSLMDNPVLGKKHYRLYVIARCPALRVLDFKKVGDKVGPGNCWSHSRRRDTDSESFWTQQEKAEARKMFSGAKGKALFSSLSEQKAKVFEVGVVPFS